MPNTFITPDVIARRALARLYNTIVLAGLVHRDYDAEFNGKVGDTISVRIPPTFEAKVFNRSTGIELQDIEEGTVPVVLDTLLDVSFAVTSEEMSLEIDDFDERLITPAMEALAQGVDARLAEELVDQAQAAGQLADGTASPNAAYRTARAILSRNKLPLMNRYAVLSPEAVSDVLGDDLFVQADQSGSTDALRNANIGRAFGFENYETQALGGGPGDAGQADGVAFHRDAVALVTRTLEKPMGVGDRQAAIANYKGLGLRVVKDYDIDKKQDVVSVDILIGVQGLRDDAAVELDFGQGS